MMSIKWNKLLAYLFLWIVSEVILNVTGLDDLADYSEFLFDRKLIVFVVQ